MEVLLELALASKRNVLLAGPSGGGKTTICRHFLQSRGICAQMHGIISLLCCYIVVFICSSMSIIIAMANGGTEILKQMVFNKATSSDSLHNFMVVNFHHRQGIHLAFPIGCSMICFQYFK